MNNKRNTILGVPVDIYNPRELMSKIDKILNDSEIHTIFSINAEKIMSARKDPELFLALKESDFLIPDGFGPVVGLRLIYGEKVFRITGIKLMEKILYLAAKKNYKVFIFGARPYVVKKALENIMERYRTLNIVGIQHGYITKEEYELLVNKINALKADILIVGLGSPKQEKWIQWYKNSLNIKLCMGVGGSLDVIAGRIPLAPSWVSNIYLEWMFRLIREPSRFKRQRVIPKFIFEMLKEAFLSRL